jgi:transcriptional regulator with AAA-type ATPase domain
MMQKSEPFGVTAQDIEDNLHIVRANASAALNQLVKDGELIKINSRPVYFLPAAVLRTKSQKKPLCSSYTPEEFLQLLQTDESKQDPFTEMIGAQESLTHQVEQGKAAILYPPKGLHTLIIGESGTGKTVFARAMYEFGVNALKKDRKNFPFVEFNCADYFHNPQLLMSHLFGHIKGAFTGANQETSGLVEKANGGILFLDEVHRLTPEGQELLFYLMDTGRYRKLGETDNLRQAQVLIIAATTESPDDVLTRTFMRRIPLTITLPPFRERRVDERLQIIQHLVQREAVATQKTYVVGPDILRALVTYDFPGNIGQLSGEIKVLCARAFLENNNYSDDLVLSFDNLSSSILQSYRKKGCEKIVFPHSHGSESMIIRPNSMVQYSSLFDGHAAYEQLIGSVSKLASQGHNKQEITEILSEQIYSYCNDILKDYYHEDIRTEELYKVVDPAIIDFTTEILKEVSKQINFKFSQKNILVFALHFKYLLERSYTGKKVSPKQIDRMEQEAHMELSVANRIVSALEDRFHTTVPPEEKYFIGILLTNITNESTEAGTQLYILAHGESTASSIANVCNRLMNCNFVQSIDVPLEQSVEETYKRLVKEVKNVPASKGLILLVDMGSLTTLGDKITQKTGIPTRTIPNVSTLMVLDVARKLLGKKCSMESIYQDYQEKNSPISEPTAIKARAILTICTSGVGTSEAFRAMIVDSLAKRDLSHIHVLSMSLNDLVNRTKVYTEARKKFEVWRDIIEVQRANTPKSDRIKRDKEGVLCEGMIRDSRKRQ